jgi:hypothetical protein
MTSRRRFLTASAAGPFLARGARAAKSEFRYPEIEARIARRDFRGLTKEDLGTPALILDLAIFEKNLGTMAAHSKATGLQIRVRAAVGVWCPQHSVDLPARGHEQDLPRRGPLTARRNLHVRGRRPDHRGPA